MPSQWNGYLWRSSQYRKSALKLFINQCAYLLKVNFAHTVSIGFPFFSVKRCRVDNKASVNIYQVGIKFLPRCLHQSSTGAQ